VPFALFDGTKVEQGGVGNKYIFIFVGGVFSADDAYKVIRQGASLVEIITGMIFEGPQVVSEINRGLVERIKRDGFKNISEVVGVDNIG
jgi:dihydroorotate dehydrogenase